MKNYKKSGFILPAILVVDDHEDILLFLSELLNDEYQPLTATDGKEACDILKKQYIHLVISDVMMPGMDGFELCDWIKTQPDFAHIPIILLTAKDAMQSKIDGLKKGADAYIEKPFSPEYLMAQIETLLRNRALTKTCYTHSPISHISTQDINRNNEKFLEEITKVIFDNIDCFEFDVNSMADILHVSRPTLYRKIKSAFQIAPNELIHQIRSNKAAELIIQGQFRISEVAEQVGYRSLSQFGRHFLRQFNMTPTEYKETIRLSYRNDYKNSNIN